MREFSYVLATLAILLAGCGESQPSAPRPSAVEDAEPVVAVRSADACGHLASVEDEVLRAPIPLRDASSNDRAAGYIAQGQAALDVFDWVEAARSFHAAWREDEHRVAAGVGLAETFLALEAPDRALRWIERAESRGARFPPDAGTQRRLTWARDRIEAVRAIGRPEAEARHRAYLARLEAHLAEDPDDVTALVLRGHADRRADGWGQTSGGGALPWYRRAVTLEPSRAGLHHFLVHALEATGRHREAWPHALRLAALAPHAPHAHHMVAHLAPALGAWDEALAALETADRLHREHFERGERTPKDDWHFGHNLRLLGALRGHFGDHAGASAAYREAFEIGYGGRRSGFYCLPWIIDRLRWEHFDEADVAATACADSSDPLAALVGAAARGEAALGQGRLDDARTALADARAARDRLEHAGRRASSEATFRFAGQVTVAILDAKIVLAAVDDQAPAAEAGAPEAERALTSIARRLCAGPSVDAWATCQPRVDELVRSARRFGRPALADALETVLTPRDSESQAPAGRARTEPSVSER